MLITEAQSNSFEVVHGEIKEKPTDSDLTTLLEAIEATIEDIKVNSFILEI